MLLLSQRLKPREKEWDELNKIKTPLLLNLAQCKLIAKDYYQVIEHCTSILDDDPSKYVLIFYIIIISPRNSYKHRIVMVVYFL